MVAGRRWCRAFSEQTPQHGTRDPRLYSLRRREVQPLISVGRVALFQEPRIDTSSFGPMIGSDSYRRWTLGNNSRNIGSSFQVRRTGHEEAEATERNVECVWTRNLRNHGGPATDLHISDHSPFCRTNVELHICRRARLRSVYFSGGASTAVQTRLFMFTAMALARATCRRALPSTDGRCAANSRPARIPSNVNRGRAASSPRERGSRSPATPLAGKRSGHRSARTTARSRRSPRPAAAP